MDTYSIDDLERIFANVPLSDVYGARIFSTVPEKNPFLVMQNLGWLKLTSDTHLAINFIVTEEGKKHHPSFR